MLEPALCSDEELARHRWPLRGAAGWRPRWESAVLSPRCLRLQLYRVAGASLTYRQLFPLKTDPLKTAFTAVQTPVLLQILYVVVLYKSVSCLPFKKEVPQSLL